MSLAVILSLAMSAVPVRAQQQPGRPAVMLSLSCVEALAAIGQPQLAGVFSFVTEKDAPQAFADLIVHDKKALKKYVSKLEKDKKETQAVSTWDHAVVVAAMSLYGSPMAETLEKPGADMLKRLDELVRTQPLPLSDMTARRRKPS